MDPSATPTPGFASAKPRAMQVITRMNIGGPARHVLDIACGLAGSFDVSVLAGAAPEIEGELDTEGVSVTRVPLVRSVDPRRDLLALQGVRRAILRQRPSLVHSHMAKAGTVARLAATTIGNRPRTVHTFHGHVLSGYFGSRTERAFAEVERRLARRTDVLIAVSPEIRDALLDLGVGQASQYEVVTPGVDLDPFLDINGRDGRFRRSLGLSKTDLLVALVARLAPIKDHRTAIKALVSLPSVHLALIGDGEQRAELASLAGALGLTRRVHFTGWRHDLPSVLSDVDAVLLTSRNEGTPLALIEAAAAARPVVATDVGGVRRVIESGKTGLLVPAGDPEAVAVALNRILYDPQLGGELGRRARNYARERFGRAHSAEAIRNIYETVLS